MQKVIVICGIKNSGKTTLTGKLVKELSGRGLRVAVIKHDGHDFTCDVPGTDTYHFTESGACGVACFSKNRAFIHRIGMGDSYTDLIAQFPEADLILIEGAKDSTYPKIEVIRKAISDQPASNPEGRFLIATDWPEGTFDEPTAGLDEIKQIADLICGSVLK